VSDQNQAPLPSSTAPVASDPLKVTKLLRADETEFTLAPNTAEQDQMAAFLGAKSLRKLRFEGRILSDEHGGLKLEGHLGATVGLVCAISLEPFNMRVETAVRRAFVPADPQNAAQGEVALAEDFDDELDELGEFIDPAEIALEELALAIPVYPRSPKAELGQAQFSAPGTVPLTDETAKPFAALAALKSKIAE